MKVRLRADFRPDHLQPEGVVTGVGPKFVMVKFTDLKGTRQGHGGYLSNQLEIIDPDEKKTKFGPGKQRKVLVVRGGTRGSNGNLEWWYRNRYCSCWEQSGAAEMLASADVARINILHTPGNYLRVPETYTGGLPEWAEWADCSNCKHDGTADVGCVYFRPSFDNIVCTNWEPK